MRCQKNGKTGWKFGKDGVCYTGPGAREKARKQGAAIKIRQGRANEILEAIKQNLSNTRH